MLKVYACIVNHHDLTSVVLAVGVCVLSCATAMSLWSFVAPARGAQRMGWLTVAASVTGIGVWATHFIAMLAFRSGFPTAYDPGQTLASMLAGIVLLGWAFHLTLDNKLRFGPARGGAIAGLAIGIMHYLGMAALRVPGSIQWDASLVAASLVVGVGFAISAFTVARGGPSLLRQGAGIALLSLAICGLHFTGMAAATIFPDPGVPIPTSAIGGSGLAGWVAAAALGLLLISLTATIASARRGRREERRLSGLANASVEGLAICDAGVIVTANESLARMVGTAANDLIGRPFASLFDQSAVPARESLPAGSRVEAPLRSADGETVPVELIAHDLTFNGKSRLAIAVRDLRERVAAEAKIRYLAHHDGLTDLPNRLSFEDRLTREFHIHRRKEDRFSVLCLDLDRFKQVNDVLGHAAGDLVLKVVSNRISFLLAEDDVFARLGGDEFAVIRLNDSSPAALAALCERILAAVAPDIPIEGQSARVGVSIGIAIYPQDGDNVDVLLRNADAALYQAKDEGRNCYRFFEEELGAQLRERAALEFDLRQALDRDEFSLVYQPETSVKDKEIFGFEALLRWSSSTRGLLGPDRFIPLAEETGLILPIGDWVLREACKEAASWSKPLQIAVNLSGVQLRSATLPRRVHEILLETGLSPERLELEITESALIEDLELALHCLRQIKALGVRVAMDDFGTGYSSLSNLRAFPFDKLKIDKSFVHNVQNDPQAATIVRAIVGLCRGLNVSVLAEGVETSEELGFLQAEMCTQAQGFLLGRPGEISDFPEAFEGPLLPPAHTSQLLDELRCQQESKRSA